ncbi:MAG TPA: DUF1761 domain-containing protein [Bacteroidia bacterium]|nr:DUF1761 domain-containing protein [Bacteroidia bacterium]
MQLNWIVLFLAALLPLILGFFWYHKSVFGTAWMKVSGMDNEKAKNMNMAKVFGLTYLFSFFIAFGLNFIVIHQWHVYSIFANEPGMADPTSEVGQYLKSFMDKYGQNFRTFKHGIFHGIEYGILTAWPVIGVNALFERKSAKYIAISAGFWIVCFALMGGVICAFA